MDAGVAAIIEWAVRGLILAYTCIQGWFLWRSYRKKPFRFSTLSHDLLPKVSVLVPARNEAHVIRRCLSCLDQLDYPTDRLEIIIGDDHSTDATAKVVRQFIQNKKHFRLISVGAPRGRARAKANALAHLIASATGEYYFITDADMCVPSTWIHALLQPLIESPQIGMVSGVTLIEGRTCRSQWQSLEWLYFLSLLRFLPDTDITAIGNNMAIRKAAYESVGGYEHLPFSVTEDLTLYHACRRRGWQHQFVFCPQSLGWTLPVFGKTLWRQRKRWLQGVKQLTLRIQTLFALKAFFPIGIIGCAMVAPLEAFLWWSINYVLQQLYIGRIAFQLNVKYRWICRCSFEWYQYLSNAVMGLLFFIPSPVIWKDRKLH